CREESRRSRSPASVQGMQGDPPGSAVHPRLVVKRKHLLFHSHAGRIAGMERSQQRLEHLYEISKLLTRFQSVERTVPEVVEFVVRTLPLRSAIFILRTGTPRTMTWRAEGESA